MRSCGSGRDAPCRVLHGSSAKELADEGRQAIPTTAQSGLSAVWRSGAVSSMSRRVRPEHDRHPFIQATLVAASGSHSSLALTAWSTGLASLRRSLSPCGPTRLAAAVTCRGSYRGEVGLREGPRHPSAALHGGLELLEVERLVAIAQCVCG